MGPNRSGYQTPNSFPSCDKLTPQVLMRIRTGHVIVHESERVTRTHSQKKFHHGRFSFAISPVPKPYVGADAFVSSHILPGVSIRLSRFLKELGSITKRGPAHL